MRSSKLRIINVSIGLAICLLFLTGCCMFFNKPPRADFNWSPSNPKTGDTVTFVNNSHDPDGSIRASRWNFGDGASSAQRNPTHVYNQSGTYTVSLTVEDKCGDTDSRSSTITVQSGSQPPQELEINIWLDKTTYAIGEDVTVHFSFNKHVSATLDEQKPNGWQNIFSNQMYSPGTYEYTGTCSRPKGDRTFYLTATDEDGQTDQDTATFECGEVHFIVQGD